MNAGSNATKYYTATNQPICQINEEDRVVDISDSDSDSSDEESGDD